MSFPCEAVILAAGAGTRLAPLTDKMPKAMVTVLNVPMLHWLTHAVALAGARKITANAFHHGSLVAAAAEVLSAQSGVPVEVVKEAHLSGPAGGLLSCYRRTPPIGPVLTLGCDIWTDAELAELIDTHNRRDADLTMMVRRVIDGREFGVVDVEAGLIKAMAEKPSTEATNVLVSCGAYVVAGDVIDRLSARSPAYDFVHVVNELLSSGGVIAAHEIAEPWLDIGNLDRYRAANLLALQSPHRLRSAGAIETTNGKWVQGHPQISRSIGVSGRVLIGDGAVVEPNCKIADSVIGPGARIGAGATVRNSVVGEGANIGAGDHVLDSVVVNQT